MANQGASQVVREIFVKQDARVIRLSRASSIAAMAFRVERMETAGEHRRGYRRLDVVEQRLYRDAGANEHGRSAQNLRSLCTTAVSLEMAICELSLSMRPLGSGPASSCCQTTMYAPTATSREPDASSLTSAAFRTPRVDAKASGSGGSL